MDKGKIYAIQCKCHPERGIRYVGQTVRTVKSRIYHHVWTTERGDYTPLKNWIRKHGAENLETILLDTAPEEQIDELEKLWIGRFREAGYELLNILEGGSQPRGHKRPKQSERMRGENNPMYGKDRGELMAYARSFQGAPTEETKALWSEQRTGEGNSRAVLTDDAVRELRSQEKRYGLFSEWARRYGVTPQSIHSAYHGKTWKHVK